MRQHDRALCLEPYRVYRGLGNLQAILVRIIYIQYQYINISHINTIISRHVMPLCMSSFTEYAKDTGTAARKS